MKKMEFTKAEKSKALLRAAIFGPSGSGKTFSALRIATGMGGKIAVIDTEHKTAIKYADRFEFDVCDLEEGSIDEYIAAINAAAKSGHDILIIDSLSHGWKKLLEEMDMLTTGKYNGNSFRAWSEGTPRQHRFIDAILSYPGHVIATMRSKTEWTIEETEKGKMKPTRIGLTPEQGKGIEYEFDLLLELSPQHYCTTLKDRTGKFQDVIIEKPGEEFGESLIAWLNEGVEPPPPPVDMQAAREALREDMTARWPGKEKEKFEAVAAEYMTRHSKVLPSTAAIETKEEYDNFVAILNELNPKEKK
jgi:hypothetical protein